jgi:DNA mismatch repair ATPase MutL
MFTAGLERELSKQVRLSRPSTLEQAIENATCLYDILNTNEPQSLHPSSSSSSYPEPMEVDTVTGYQNKQNKNNSWNNSNASNNNNTWSNRNAGNNNNKNNNNTSRSNNNTNQRYTSTNNKNTSNNNNNNNFVNPPPLNQAWRARCQALGLCRRCRQPGHFAVDCPIYALNNFNTEPDPETSPTPPEAIDSSSGKA